MKSLLKRGVLLFVVSTFMIALLAPCTSASLDPNKLRVSYVRPSVNAPTTDDDPFPSGQSV
ncbi:MAG TPA: hypothetical protein VMS71_04120, partial [Candidatus Acidoferrum sp.]|nr:hypothetical protein [Candidatus Acidoferrum sp.]